ncbi:hypothetical protein D3C81_2335230 [compost metagenome]
MLCPPARTAALKLINGSNHSFRDNKNDRPQAADLIHPIVNIIIRLALEMV